MDLAANRARVAMAVAGRDCSDFSRGLVHNAGRQLPAGEQIRAWRRLRALTLDGLDLVVLLELAEGATWEQVSRALGLPEDETRRRYEPTWLVWQARDVEPNPVDGGRGFPTDRDPAGTARALDQWLERHREPWDEAASRALSELL